MRVAQLGAMDLPAMLAGLLGAAICYAAWLTSIVCSCQRKFSDTRAPECFNDQLHPHIL